MATIFDLSENTAPDGTDRLYITDGTNDEGVQIANLLKGSGAEVPAAKITGTVSASNLPTITHEKGGLEADVSAYDGIVQISGGSTSAIKNNWSASAAPTTGDDSGDGYVVGSRWIDTTNDKEYVCLDNTAAAAVWTETTGGGGGGVLVAMPVPTGSSFSSGFYTFQFSTTQVRRVAQVRSTVSVVGAQFFLPTGATSIDSLKVYMSSDNLTEDSITVVSQAVASGEDEDTGGTFANTTLSSWYSPGTAGEWLLVDLASAIPGTVAAEDIITVTFKNSSASAVTSFGPVILTYS